MIDYDVLSKEISAYRRDLHKIPELGFFVYKTNAYVKAVLDGLDCQVETVAKTGLVAYFDFGGEKTLCFRADMDGLPIEEETGLDFASTHEGCMHACGHDGHMANLLGFAKVLNSYRTQGRQFKYNALLLFQPAEETIDGALTILGTHIFEQFKVASIFGLHMWPFLEEGEITTKPGVMMAKSTALAVEIEGLSAHCGEPDKGHDALAAACRYIDLLYDFKSEHIRERSVLKFGEMKSGTVRNIISDYTRLDGTMRTFDDLTNKRLVNAMKHYARQLETLYEVKFTVDTSKYHPAVVNDADLYLKIKEELLSKHLNFVELRRPSMIAEDFSFFEERIPGLFFFLGTGTKIPLHSNNFNFDDAVLINGVQLFNTIFLGSK
ncbi:M20 metallopeptidase family protein [Aminicella lysinilytica]|uniref:Hippurate hydrolase n=1 Tax=Aminicella lysinilytica TaxID=433323 RepID=A0A4R6PYS5_9FIRM|nr:amidohydrolase [Aminicella lysinilytica]TDP49875.1 hippurate hydrolase [Aminicella lysinilytica]